MNKKRVVITGMGVVSCFGNDVEQFYNSLLQGKSGVTPITAFPCEDYPTRFAAAIHNFDPGEYIDKKQARRVDPCIAYAMVAGKKALEAAKLTGEAFDSLNKMKAGVIIGSGIGGMGIFSNNVESLIQKGVRRVSPFFVPYTLTNMPGGLLGIDLGFRGPNYSISTACATSNYTIIAAANHIKAGEADVILCGGTEAPITPIGLAGFSACKALSERNDEPQRASRPWDTQRDGFVMGEGSGVLVLESLEHALARGAPILGEFLGGGISCDAHHMTDPRPDGMGVIQCIEQALHNAEITPDQVNYINAHGTSTPVGDVAELGAIKKVFANRSHMKMNSTKSMIGHSLGAAGALEAIAVVMSFMTGMVHPTINHENPEPDLGIDIVPNYAQKHNVSVALSNSFGFGGHNSSIVLAPYRP
ncbi:MAG: fabF [Chlamydiales bacterium]|jgi:3-oxoacyl-[acyl-carrier-protein] synthase II|nr:fabF [Chlamydiales bacterium]